MGDFKDPDRVRAYHREYGRQYRSAGGTKDSCPECGKPKEKQARACRRCSYKKRSEHELRASRVRRVHVDVKPGMQAHCPFCLAPMRRFEWREKAFWHCTGCGLETTAVDMERIEIENQTHCDHGYMITERVGRGLARHCPDCLAIRRAAKKAA